MSANTNNPVADAVQDICDHMNADHRDALVLLCEHYGGVRADSVEMVGVDGTGFDVLPDSAPDPVRIAFPEPVSTPNDVRLALIRMLKQARGG